MIKRTIGLLVLGFTAVVQCAGAQGPPGPPPPTLLHGATHLPARCTSSDTQVPGEHLAIDRPASQIQVFVYRAGPLAGFGHDHIVSTRDIWGYVTLGDDLKRSRLDLCVPVASLVVDDPKLRVAAGADFAKQPSPSAVAGTRRHMLGTVQLDGQHYPFVEIHGTVAGGRLPKLDLELVFTVRGVTHRVRTTTDVRTSAEGLTASGTLTIRQSQLGITPYSALFGALKVRDTLVMRYKLVATPLGSQ